MSTEIKLGNKLTEVGVIPEDWSVMPLRELTTEIGDGIHSTPIYSRNSEYSFINGNNLQDGRVTIFNETKSVSYSEFKKHRKNLGDNSILMSINGTIGNLGLFSGEPIILGKSAAYLNLKNDFSRLFVYYALQSDCVKTQFSDGLTGTTIRNLGLGTIRDTGIPLPASLIEQHAIAAALSDMDALISGLDQLIAKKRDIKQAAMQQLLTGQQRLPGFSGEWEMKRLGDVLRVRHGKNQSAIEVSGGKFPILATGGEIGRTNTFLYDKPSVLIGRKGTIDRPIYRDEPFWTVDTLFYTEIVREAVPVFIYYKFLMIDWRSYNESSGVPSLNASTIEAVEIVIPSIAEQAAIATILSEMDSELATLETRSDKARQLKQGMMQELLTGRVRLPSAD